MKKNLSERHTSASGSLSGNFLPSIEGILRAFTGAGKADKALVELAVEIRKLIGNERVFAYLFARPDSLLVPASELEPGQPETIQVPEEPAALAAEDQPAGQEIVVDLENPPADNPWRKLADSIISKPDTAGKIRLVLPLNLDSKLFGAIVVCESRTGRKRAVFNPQTIELLNLAGRLAELGLERFSLAREAKKSGFKTRLKSLELEMLQDVGIAIASTLDLAELTRELLLRAVSVMNVNRALIMLSPEADKIIHRDSGQPETVRMRPVESFGLEEVNPGLLSDFGGSELIAENLSNHNHTIINNPDQAPEPLGCRKLLTVPIQFKEELLGAILVADKEGRHGKHPDFNEDDLGLLTSIANQAGAAISNARLYRDVLEIKNYNENILRSIASGVITADSEGLIVSYNESAARIFGIPAEQAETMQLRQLFAELGNPNLGDQLHAISTRGDTYQETNLRALAKNGTEVVFNISASPLDKDELGVGQKGMVISVENISEGARVKEMLKRYVNPGVVDMALASGQELVLGGMEREVTILFADIRGFTPLSEQRTPQEVVDILNSFFDLMIDVAFQHNGTVDKIVGDEIMVLFGAPFPFGDDSRRAVSCALSMQEALVALNRQRQADGEDKIEIGIGINHGSVISGNIGSTKQMSYTVIGDAVNLASRLVDYAGRGQILISRSVFNSLDKKFRCRKIDDSLRVKGKKEPVEVFEVLGALNMKE
jgi:adenylate cyclase